jgi:hypothetical protein
MTRARSRLCRRVSQVRLCSDGLACFSTDAGRSGEAMANGIGDGRRPGPDVEFGIDMVHV